MRMDAVIQPRSRQLDGLVHPSEDLPPTVLVIGASTGGPQALTTLVAHLVPVMSRLPVCVTLHTPAELMSIMAAHVARVCGVETRIVTAPQPLRPNVVYFAPGNRHLHFKGDGFDQNEIGFTSSVPRDACKPAVDVMFTSAAECFGPRALGVVLSGMGVDGLAGARALVTAGAKVFVQDKESSPVWGMPGAVVKANLAAAILPPKRLAERIVATWPLAARLP